MSERIENLRQLVEHSFHCKATHVASKPIREVFVGKIVWEGIVETFDLDAHPKAKRCYAFEMKDGQDPERAGELVLEIPPVNSPESAVQVAIASKAR